MHVAKGEQPKLSDYLVDYEGAIIQAWQIAQTPRVDPRARETFDVHTGQTWIKID